jgi:hypothetical protein
MASQPLSTYTREVYDIRQGWNVFSFKRENPNLEMIGSLRLTEHGLLPLVCVRGAGVPALGKDGQPFVYRNRHIDPFRTRLFEATLQDALYHLASLMEERAEDVPLRSDKPQADAVAELVEWTRSLPRQADALAFKPTHVPQVAPLQVYDVETYDLRDGEIVALAADGPVSLDCRIIETNRGWLPASHLESDVVHVDTRAHLQPSGDSIMIPPGADAPTVSAFISTNAMAIAPTAFYDDPLNAAVAAVLELQRTARGLWHMSDATEAERASVQHIHAWADSLDPLQAAQEFIAGRALSEPSVF